MDRLRALLDVTMRRRLARLVADHGLRIARGRLEARVARSPDCVEQTIALVRVLVELLDEKRARLADLHGSLVAVAEGDPDADVRFGAFESLALRFPTAAELKALAASFPEQPSPERELLRLEHAPDEPTRQALEAAAATDLQRRQGPAAVRLLVRRFWVHRGARDRALALGVESPLGSRGGPGAHRRRG